jgi:hypothetical protein
MIFDLRPFKHGAVARRSTKQDVAKRLMTTASMRRPSRSPSPDDDDRADGERAQGELDRFYDALIAIRKEIQACSTARRTPGTTC